MGRIIEEAYKRYPKMMVREADNVFSHLTDINKKYRDIFIEGCMYAVTELISKWKDGNKDKDNTDQGARGVPPQDDGQVE